MYFRMRVNLVEQILRCSEQQENLVRAAVGAAVYGRRRSWVAGWSPL